MRAVTVNGAPTDWFEQGRGPPVVLVHGAPSDYRVWMPHCEAVARYRVIT